MWHASRAALLRPVASAAVHALAEVDYTVANRVTDAVAHVVPWSYAHHVPFVGLMAVQLLQRIDGAGGVLISFAVWLVALAA